MKHTKGPWVIENSETDGLVIFAENDPIANLQVNAKANATLIAAAPEMLEALELAYHAIKLNNETKDALIAVNAAIKKAKGE